MKIMAGTLRAFIILCSFFFFIFFFQDGNHQAFFLPFFFSIIRDSVNRVTKRHPSRHSSPLHEEKNCWISRIPPTIFPFETLSSTDVFSFSFVLRIDTWNNFDMFFSRARRSLCIDIFLRRNVSCLLLLLLLLLYVE